MFELVSEFQPKGDQPEAIKALTEGVSQGKKTQVLLGITGSGKTFTMANVIQNVQRPTLVIAHNKTLAGQLFREFKAFFPHNAVEYFVSYYDYYQPEAYVPRTDTYIEKDLSINDYIDKMRLSATRSLLERDDVIIVSSVSCIYGLGTPEYYKGMNLTLNVGDHVRRDDVLLHLVEMQYKRNDFDFWRSTFRVRGDILDIFPAYEEDLAIRIEFFGDDVDRISEFDPLTGETKKRLASATIYPSSHHVTPEEVRLHALETIQSELEERVHFYEAQKKELEKQRIDFRTKYDMEMIREIGFCKGIENYSRHFSERVAGEPPPCLIDYFPKNFLTIIDESHQTIPQLHAMYNGDRSRKETLIEFGFRLPSAFDNRPLKFEEVYNRVGQVVYVSATPSSWEINEAEGEIIEQVIRPTGLLDPIIEIKPAKNQVDDCLNEIRKIVAKRSRVLVTTLTKRLAEELTNYLIDVDVRAKYLHSDIDTLERLQIIDDLRTGVFDVLVGINLLREGLDIPEVSLITILDADKEGFLRSETALIQICGRAARNSEGRVVMYADKMTSAIQRTLAITQKRRSMQEAYNLKHGIIPKTVKREIAPLILPEIRETREVEFNKKPKHHEIESLDHLTIEELEKKIRTYEKKMKEAAKSMNFEEAASFRDAMRRLQRIELNYGGTDQS